MKLTKDQLKKIIEEEMLAIREVGLNDEGDNDSDEKDAEALKEPSEVDVKGIADLLPKIDQPDEYAQLLTMILKYGNNIHGKENILRQLQSQLSNFIGTV